MKQYVKMEKNGKSSKVNLDFQFNFLQKNTMMIKTYAIDDGACFFHSVLHCIDNSYHSGNTQEKKTMALQLRKRIANTITIKKWKNRHLSTDPWVAVSIKINSYFKSMYNYIRTLYTEVTGDFEEYDLPDNIKNKIKEETLSENLEYYNTICEIITFENFEKIFNQVDTECNKYIREDTSFTIDHCIELFKEKLNIEFQNNIESIVSSEDELSNKILEFYLNKFNDLINMIFEEAKFNSFNDYKKNVENMSEWAGIDLIALTSEYLKIDIYIIKDNNLYKWEAGCPYYKRDTIMIYNISNVHYEPIGIYNKNTGDIKRQLISTKKNDMFYINQLYKLYCGDEVIIQDSSSDELSEDTIDSRNQDSSSDELSEDTIDSRNQDSDY